LKRKEEKNNMSRDYLGFTLNVRTFVNLLCQDPSTYAEVLAGIQEAANAPVATTSPLGAANLTPGENVEPTFCSVFAATVQGKASGETGLFYRNNSRGGDGTRIQMRIRKQAKRQQTATTEAVMPSDSVFIEGLGHVTRQQAATLLAQAGLLQNTPPQPAPQAEFKLPTDIDALVNG